MYTVYDSLYDALTTDCGAATTTSTAAVLLTLSVDDFLAGYMADITTTKTLYGWNSELSAVGTSTDFASLDSLISFISSAPTTVDITKLKSVCKKAAIVNFLENRTANSGNQ